MKPPILLIMSIMALAISSAFAQFSIYSEAGLAFTGYNDARIPNDDNNDMFSLKDDLEPNVPLAGRINLYYNIGDRHQLGLLFAPLTIKSSGSFDRDIRYRGETFLMGEDIKASYRFNSYRLQYRYLFANQNIIIRAVGLSVKVRDAEISLKAGDKFATKTDLGFVPLISLRLGYDFNEMLAISLDGEGLGSPFGRAEDILTTLDIRYNDKLTFKAGYRFLEGGSDIDEVYTFAMIHYPVLGMSYRF